MNFAKFARTTVMAGLVMAALWGLPQAAQAEEIVAESGNQSGVCHGVTVLAWARVDGVSPSGGSDDPMIEIDSIQTDRTESTATDDVWVDGKIITAENYDSTREGGDIAAPDVDDQAEQTVQSDPEWKYVPVRR